MVDDDRLVKVILLLLLAVRRVRRRHQQAQCLDIYGVKYKQSALSNDHRRMICQYEAADTESVRKVQREIGAPFDDIWTGTIIT